MYKRVIFLTCKSIVLSLVLVKAGGVTTKRWTSLKQKEKLILMSYICQWNVLVNRPFKNSWGDGILAWVSKNIVSLMESLLSVEKLWKKAQSKRQIIIRIDFEAQHLYETQPPLPPTTLCLPWLHWQKTNNCQDPHNAYKSTNQPTHQSPVNTWNYLHFLFHQRLTWLMFGSVFTWNQKCDLSGDLVLVKGGGHLADEGAVVLLLDVGHQQVEGARALNRSLSCCLGHFKEHFQGHCEERVLNSEQLGRGHLNNNHILPFSQLDPKPKRLKNFVQRWLVCLDDGWKVCSWEKANSPILFPRVANPSPTFSSQHRRGKAEKLPKRQCLEFGIIMQPCLGQDCGILCLSKLQHCWLKKALKGTCPLSVRLVFRPSVRTDSVRTVKVTSWSYSSPSASKCIIFFFLSPYIRWLCILTDQFLI